MTTPKGVRAIAFQLRDDAAVHVYSDVTRIWLQLRRDVPTESSIAEASFKVALELTSEQAIAIAGELLTAGTRHKAGRKLVDPTVPVKAQTPPPRS